MFVKGKQSTEFDALINLKICDLITYFKHMPLYKVLEFLLVSIIPV